MRGCFSRFYWQTEISTKTDTNMKATTPKRNEQMSLSHRNYFANFIKSRASYKSFAFECLRIFKKSTSRSTNHRIKKNTDSILGRITNLTKNSTFNRKNENELKQIMRHCRNSGT